MAYNKIQDRLFSILMLLLFIGMFIIVWVFRLGIIWLIFKLWKAS